jgi:hypothetical protein
MNIESKLLNRLKESQLRYSVDSLKQPVQRDAFEYGHRTGVVAGYEAAINVLLQLIDEDKYRDNDL